MPEQENMTTEERIQKIREETERINQRVVKMQEEREERWKESDKRIAKMRAESEEWRKQSDKRAAKRRRKFDKKWKELSKEIAKVNATATKLAATAKEHGKQIGGHNNKFGSYTEALAEPSVRRVLDEYFDADYMESYERGNLQLDGWGIARNGTGAAYIVEVKSKFEPEHLDQVWRLVRHFRIENPEFESREVYPILAVVEIDKDQRELVWQSGIHLIDVSDGVFEWTRPPMGFRPCGDYGANGVVRRAVPRHLRLVADKGRGQQQAQ